MDAGCSTKNFHTQSGRDVHVRCEHLQYIDCAGVQVLMALNEALRARGAGMTVQNLPDSIQQTLRITGLASAL